MTLDIHATFLQFYEITAARKSYGQNMVAAVLEAVPQGWEVCLVMDWSGAFWPNLKLDAILRLWYL